MTAISKYTDLVKTIDEDEEVENFSEESDVEVEVSLRLCLHATILRFLPQFQPSRQKNKEKLEFDNNFEFVSSVEEYNKDAWNDLVKYVKRKAKTKTDDKIKKLRKQNVNADDEEDVKPKEEVEEAQNNGDVSDISLSEDELKHDNIRTKERKKTKKVAKELNGFGGDADEFFEDVELPDEHTSFYQMNLSRPLLKAIGEMKFVHPTPIQAATIPLALLGQYLRIKIIIKSSVQTIKFVENS